MSVTKYLGSLGQHNLADAIRTLGMGRDFLPADKNGMTVFLPAPGSQPENELVDISKSDEDTALLHFRSLIVPTPYQKASSFPSYLVNFLGQQVNVSRDSGYSVNGAKLVSDKPAEINTPEGPVYVYQFKSGSIGIENEKAKTGGAMIDVKSPVESLYKTVISRSRIAYTEGEKVCPIAEIVLSAIAWGLESGKIGEFRHRIKPMPELSFPGIYSYFMENNEAFNSWIDSTRGVYISKMENIHEEYLRVYNLLYTEQKAVQRPSANSARPEITKAIKATYKSAYDLHSDESALIGISDLKEMVSCELNKDYSKYNYGSAFGPLSDFLRNTMLARFPSNSKDFESSVSTRGSTPFDIAMFAGITHLLIRSDMFNYQIVDKSSAAKAPAEITFQSKGSLPTEFVSVAGYYYKLQQSRAAAGYKACITEQVVQKFKVIQ